MIRATLGQSFSDIPARPLLLFVLERDSVVFVKGAQEAQEMIQPGAVGSFAVLG